MAFVRGISEGKARTGTTCMSDPCARQTIRWPYAHARDVYTRRNEGVSIWVVPSANIVASSPAEKDPFFAPSGDKVYRHPTFYDIPDSVPQHVRITSTSRTNR